MSVEKRPKADVVVLYLPKDDSYIEQFTGVLTHEEGLRRAEELEASGHEVLSLVTPEHAKERQSAMKTVEKEGVSMDGVHLHQFLHETVRNFRKFYPGASREAALEVTRLLCGNLLDGEEDLQTVLLDEIHNGHPIISSDGPNWRTEILMIIANRQHGEN